MASQERQQGEWEDVDADGSGRMGMWGCGWGWELVMGSPGRKEIAGGKLVRRGPVQKSSLVPFVRNIYLGFFLELGNPPIVLSYAYFS